MRFLHKPQFLWLFLAVLMPLTGMAQDNRGFAYQGYARDANGEPMVDVAVAIRFTIANSFANPLYQETHTVRTDQYGLYQATLGTRNTNEFAKVAFNPASSYTLRTEVGLAGGSLVEVSNGPMNWVPYAATARNGIPPGTILPFGGPKANIPPGYLACDGAVYNKTQYPALYNAIGGAWGESGAQFRVPDLRGVFLRGQNDGRPSTSAAFDPDANSRESVAGGASGDNVGSFQKDEIQRHTHTSSVGTDGSHTHTWGYPWSSSEGSVGSVSILLDDQNMGSFSFGTTNTTGMHTHQATINNSTGATATAESRPRNAYVYYIIKH